MKLTAKFTLLLFLFIVLGNSAYTQLFGPKKFKLPNGKLKQMQVCGSKNCEPGKLGTIQKFTGRPYSPDVDATSTERAIALQIVGHTFPKNDFREDKIFTCDSTSKNPFSENDITTLGTEGMNIDYHRTEKLDIDIDAAVKTNLDSLKKYTSDITKIQKVEASIRAAYSKIAGKDLTITGTYSEWGLKNDVIDKLAKDDGFTGCKKFLTDHKHKIITAIGLVYFTISYNTNSLDSLASEIQAEIGRQGINYSVSFTFKRVVSETLESTTKNYYQILVWRSANLKDVHLFRLALLSN